MQLQKRDSISGILVSIRSNFLCRLPELFWILVINSRGQVVRSASKRFFLLPLILLFCGTAISGADELQKTPSGQERPNIIFLLADDQCTYSMGCYGTPNVQTPNMDQLAQDGLVFDKHYDTTAICMASRVNIMTGKYEYKAGCNFDSGPLLEEHWMESYPILLREAGYRTAFAGKFGFEVSKNPKGKSWLPEKDFDVWGGGPGQTSYQTGRNPAMKQYAKDYPHSTLSYGAFGRDFILDSAKQDRPFCLSISFKAPHHPTTPDPKFDQIYQGKNFVKPMNFGREYGLHFADQSRLGRQYERFHSWHYSDDYDTVMAIYYQQIYAIDVALGMIRDALRDAGVQGETVVIYTSDNGFLCGSHGYGSKVLPYEESSRVPLIIYDPRKSVPEAQQKKQLLRTQPLEARESRVKDLAVSEDDQPVIQDLSRYRRCGALTGNVDIAATILALAGLPQPSEMDGKDLMPLYDNPEQGHHAWLPLINVWGPSAVHSFSVVTPDWKFIRWPSVENGMEPTEELYHLKSDPLEITNRLDVRDMAADQSRMRALYDQAVLHWQDEGVSYHGYPQHGQKMKR